jgi:acyl homoserine lactone synthase
MFRLRSAVFSDRLGWAVKSIRGREHDRFDELEPVYMIARDSSCPNRALGCWRLLPTSGPNMLRDVFPDLLGGVKMPCGPQIWEISRFAVATETQDRGPAFGFSEIPVAMLRRLFSFSRELGIDAFVGVTSAAVERLTRNLGLPMRRFAPARRIGDVLSLAFHLPMDEQSEAVLGTPAPVLPATARAA